MDNQKMLDPLAAAMAAMRETADDPIDAAPEGMSHCGCGVGERSAVSVDPDIKDRNTKRLRRIEGQVRGLQKMVEEERYCADILVQISSVHEALRGVARELMRNHLKHCAASAIRSEEPGAADAMYDEIIELMFKHAR